MILKVISASTPIMKESENGDIKWVPVTGAHLRINSNRIRSTWKIGSKGGIDGRNF